jgi:hypothetical protein
VKSPLKNIPVMVLPGRRAARVTEILKGQLPGTTQNHRKSRKVKNAQNSCRFDAVFEALLSNKPFTEACNFLRSHAKLFIKIYSRFLFRFINVQSFI